MGSEFLKGREVHSALHILITSTQSEIIGTLRRKRFIHVSMDGFSHVIETMAEFTTPTFKYISYGNTMTKGCLQTSPQTLPSTLVKIRKQALKNIISIAI